MSTPLTYVFEQRDLFGLDVMIAAEHGHRTVVSQHLQELRAVEEIAADGVIDPEERDRLASLLQSHNREEARHFANVRGIALEFNELNAADQEAGDGEPLWCSGCQEHHEDDDVFPHEEAKVHRRKRGSLCYESKARANHAYTAKQRSLREAARAARDAKGEAA